MKDFLITLGKLVCAIAICCLAVVICIIGLSAVIVHKLTEMTLRAVEYVCDKISKYAEQLKD